MYSTHNKYVIDHNLVQLTFIYIQQLLYLFILHFFFGESFQIVYCITYVI